MKGKLVLALLIVFSFCNQVASKDAMNESFSIQIFGTSLLIPKDFSIDVTQLFNKAFEFSNLRSKVNIEPQELTVVSVGEVGDETKKFEEIADRKASLCGLSFLSKKLSGETGQTFIIFIFDADYYVSVTSGVEKRWETFLPELTRCKN